MTKLLEEALADAQALSEHQQDRLAYFIKRLVHDPEAVNSDACWEMLLADPRSNELLENSWRSRPKRRSLGGRSRIKAH